MNELALFSGAGGGILGGTLLGWRTVCAVEIDPYCRKVLLARQRDGILPRFPIWDDVRTFSGSQWRGHVDVVSGGFPCQDISVAGKGEGLNGSRSGLWGEFARIIGEVRPRYVFVENVPALLVRGGVRVLGDLAALGYDARWGVVSAADAGAPHRRERIWIVADANTGQCNGSRQALRAGRIAVNGSSQDVADSAQHGRGEGRQRGSDPGGARERERALQDVADADCGRLEVGMQSYSNPERSEQPASFRDYPNGCGSHHAYSNRESMEWAANSRDKCRFWESEPDVGRVAHGVAARVDRLRALGNGQVPRVAQLAWRILGD